MRFGLDPALLLRTACLAGFGLGAGTLLQVLRPDRVSLTPPAQPLACSAAPEEFNAPPVSEEADPVDVLPLCGRPRVVLADMRAASLFAGGHVAGALHIPCSAGPLSPEKKARLAAATTIVVIGESTSAGFIAANALRPYAPEARLQVLRGGFAAWEAAGFACASGPCEECVSSSPPRSPH